MLPQHRRKGKEKLEWRKYCYYFPMAFSCVCCVCSAHSQSSLVAWLQLTTDDSHVSVCPHRVPCFLAEGSELLTEFILNHLCFLQREMFGLDPDILSAACLVNGEAKLAVLPQYSWCLGKPLNCFLPENILRTWCSEFPPEKENKQVKELATLK